MLIVKGETQKSVLVNILMEETDSICLDYNNRPVIYNSISCNKAIYSLGDFMQCIAEECQRLNAYGVHCDYLIIYTNEKEEDLKEFIDWLDYYRWEIPCKDILVTCK